MKTSLLISALFALTVSHAHAQAPARADVWGKSPTATDDRFSNPKSKLYAGPDGWWNSGEVRAAAGSLDYGFKGTFRQVSGMHIAVKDLQTLYFNFGDEARPKPGVYKIGAKGDAAQKTVALSFADVGNKQIKEWKSRDGAGTLTVTLVNGFTYFTTRNVPLQPSGPNNTAEAAKAMTLGFEGALSPE
jgi:hypothetical protein